MRAAPGGCGSRALCRSAVSASAAVRPARTASPSCVRKLLVGGPDRAAHPGAAEAAIAHRVLGQILLVVVLGEIELRRIEDLGGDRVETPRLERLLVHRLGSFRGLALRRREGVDAGAVLRTNGFALS